MENETSSMIRLAVALITMSALLSLIIVMAFTGRKVAYNYLDTAGQIQLDLEEGELNYLKENEIEMPSASVLALVKQNDDLINEVYLNYNNLYGTAIHGRLYDDNGKRTNVYNTFEQNIRSKVKIYLTQSEDLTGYDLYIHDIACDKDVLHVGKCKD